MLLSSTAFVVDVALLHREHGYVLGGCRVSGMGLEYLSETLKVATL